MKLCFSTLGCSEMNLEEILAICSDFGIFSLEIRGIGGVLDNSNIEAFSAEASNSTKRSFEQSGVIPTVLGTSCAFHNREKFDKAISEGLEAIKIAEALSIPYIRVFGDKIAEGDEFGCTERVISGIRTLCENAKNTTVLLEIHGNLNTEKTLAPVLDGLSDINNFGLIWDIEHTQDSYGENWIEFYRFVRPYIKHVHIKDRNKENRLVLLSVSCLAVCNDILCGKPPGYRGGP